MSVVPPADGRSQSKRKRRIRIPRAVLAATAAFMGLTAVWSVVAPITEAPDEQMHLGMVLYLADGHPYPSYDEVHVQHGLIWLCREFSASTTACPRIIEFKYPVGPVRRHPIAEAPDKSHRLAWDDEGGDEPLQSINQMGQHPPLYYSTMAAVLRAERAVTGGNWSLDRELALLRLIDVLMVAPIPLLAWWAAKRFGLDDVTSLGAACVMLGLPMLTHIGGALNNDNLVAVFGAALIALLAGVVRGDRKRSTAIGVGAVLAAALLSKSLGAVFAPLVVLAYALGWWNQRKDAERPAARSAVVPLAISTGVALLLAGWWYVRVRVQTGQFAPTVESRSYNSKATPPGFHPDLPDYLFRFLKLMNVRVWGSFGWHTVRIPGELALLMTALVVAAVAVALWPGRDQAGNGRLNRAFLLLPVAGLFLFVLARAWNLYSLTGKYPFIQGRYLLAGTAGLAVLIALGVRRVAHRGTALAIAVVGGLLQLYSLLLCLRTWWGGPGLGPRGQLDALAAWSGWPGVAVAAIFVVALAAGTWFAVELILDLRRIETEDAT
ncbi:DUF2142 domain-containing protein [Aquihabitans sp. McL0605]|uniref:DUF2142 domain-containing protein n=1 Tax=Aquihabitans sp. McL0605 TaxID=3415671 RepID=UPI003CEB5D4D